MHHTFADSDGLPAPPKRLRQVADSLRQWSDSILQSVEGPDERAGTEMFLCSHVRFLGRFANSLDATAQLHEGHPPFQLRSVDQCNLVARHVAECLRSSQRGREKAVGLIAPRSVLCSLQERMEASCVPSKSTVRRARFLFAIAFALAMRPMFASHALPRMVYCSWCDSSPQGGRDWLISHVHILPPRSSEEILREGSTAGRALTEVATCRSFGFF